MREFSRIPHYSMAKLLRTPFLADFIIRNALSPDEMPTNGSTFFNQPDLNPTILGFLVC